MALLLKTIYNNYKWLMESVRDPRTAHFPMVHSPITPLSIVFLYAMFSIRVGPNFMRNRKPFNIDKLMIVFNFLQVIYCAYIVEEGVRLILFEYDWRCAPIDWSYSEEAKHVINLVWSYYMIKYIDLLDTVFFILRKKFSQVTFLHVYHHGGMVILTWIATKFMPGGHWLYLGIVNCFVHAVMYFYYLLTAYNKEYKNSLWWKKHITQLQLAQFTFFTLTYGQLLFRENCNFPLWPVVLFLPQNIFMAILFADFYYKTYIKTNKK